MKQTLSTQPSSPAGQTNTGIIEALPVIAYLSPDPLDDDSYIEEDWISWIPGYLNSEEYGVSYLHPHNIDLARRIESFTEEQFQKAFKRLKSLWHDKYVKQMTVGIDYSGMLGSDGTASFDYVRSEPECGHYSFAVHRRLLYRYANQIIQSEQAASDNLGIWEHEIIHALDYRQILIASAFRDSKNPLNGLTYYTLRYREEGIANLLALLDGDIDGVHSIHEAKALFTKNCERVGKELLALEETSDNDRGKIFEGHDFYEAGPWLILDMLSDYYSVVHEIDMASIEKRIQNKETFSESEKLGILSAALKFISTSWFLSSIDAYLYTEGQNHN
ncbi:MAG: hypothetical protein FJ344_07465 [Sphingomonadales bacterium]|nr:hypothetical protein [Sphingomonadales bacterium]